MSLVIACGNQRFTVTGDEALIGRDTACAVALPEDARLAARHAALRMVGGRWLIEARADSLLQVGSAAPARLGWLNDGDVIRLTPSGPELIVNPSNTTPISVTATPAAVPSVASVAPATPTPVAKPESPITAPAAVWKRQSNLQTTPVDESSSRTSPAIWEDWKKPVAISAAIVIGVAVIWGLIANLGSTPIETKTETTSKDREADPTSAQPVVAPAKKIEKPAAAPINVSDSVYAVLIASEDRQQVYQIGTAWAVSPQRLVTSAAVVQAVEKLRPVLGAVLVRHPATKSDFFVAERAHPKFVELTEHANELQSQIGELDQQLDKATDAAEKKTLEQKVEELDLQLIALFRETMYFDIGVLETRDRLPHVLPQADMRTAKGQRLRLLGVPFPEDEQLLNPDRPPRHQELSGQFLATLPEIESAPSPIIFNVALKDLQGHQWSGAPVLNAAGQVVAVFSRLAPPDIKGPPDPNQLRPHATDIRALRGLIP